MPITDCFSCCECDCCSIECEGDCTWVYRCEECLCSGACTWQWTPCPDTETNPIPFRASTTAMQSPLKAQNVACPDCDFTGNTSCCQYDTATGDLLDNPCGDGCCCPAGYFTEGSCTETEFTDFDSCDAGGGTWTDEYWEEYLACYACGSAPEPCTDGFWTDVSLCQETGIVNCPVCSCTFDDMANGNQPGTADPDDPETAQTFNGTCGEETVGCGSTCSWTWLAYDPVANTGGYWEAVLPDNCGECECHSPDDYAYFDPPYADGTDTGDLQVVPCLPVSTSFAALAYVYDPYVGPGEEDCYWELTTDCGENNNSGCQCANRTCEWEWGADSYWKSTSDCGCENCDCPAPSGQGSPIPGSIAVTMTTHCSGAGTSGGAGHTVSCDCDTPNASTNECPGVGQCEYVLVGNQYTYVTDNCESGCSCPENTMVNTQDPPLDIEFLPCIDSNATGYEDGETATTPCYGGDCDTSNASCCIGGDCMYLWNGGMWTVDTDTCFAACADPDVLCECHEPTYSGSTADEVGQGACMPVATTAALSNRTFGLSSKIPRIRNSREEIRNSSALKVTRKGVSKVYLNVKAIKRKRRAMARKVASRRQRMR